MDQHKIKIEERIVAAIVIFTVGIFCIFPAHASSDWHFALSSFLDRYLFGNGYFKPSDFPFAAKVTNSLPLPFILTVGICMGVYRNDIVVEKKKQIYAVLALAVILLSFLVWQTTTHQELKASTSRLNFMNSESYQNSILGFLFWISVKNVAAYLCVRMIISTTVMYWLGKVKVEPREELY